MHKSLITLSILGLTFALNASAAVTHYGPPVSTSASVNINSSTQLSFGVPYVNTSIPDDVNDLAGKNIFKLAISSSDTNTQISIAGVNNTAIRSDGLVVSARREGTDSALIAEIKTPENASITNEQRYLPEDTTPDSYAMLLADGVYQEINFNGPAAEVKQNISAGEYVFNFVAQAYSD